MVLIKSKDKNGQTPRDIARAAVATYTTAPDEPSIARLVLVRKGKHLDVDGILARSLPQFHSQLSSRQGGKQEINRLP